MDCSRTACDAKAWGEGPLCLVHLLAHLSEHLEEDERGDLRALLSTLSFREREIVKLRSGLGDGHGYSRLEVGRLFKLDVTAVARIEDEVATRMANPVRSRVLAGCVDRLPNDKLSNALRVGLIIKAVHESS